MSHALSDAIHWLLRDICAKKTSSPSSVLVGLTTRGDFRPHDGVATLGGWPASAGRSFRVASRVGPAARASHVLAAEATMLPHCASWRSPEDMLFFAADARCADFLAKATWAASRLSGAPRIIGP